MSFLAPLFLVASAAIAIPIFVHLIQRERKRVIQFPSLMFVQRIPYQSVRRRRIRHWALLMMRCAALLLIVAAFARPFLKHEIAAASPSSNTRATWRRASAISRTSSATASASSRSTARW